MLWRQVGFITMLSFDEGCLALSWRSLAHTKSFASSSVQSTPRAPPLASVSSSTTTVDVKASSRAPTPFLSPPDDEPCSFIDIGANLLDPMFLGQYNGKQKHECDLDALLERAAEQDVEAIIITAGSLEDAKAAQTFVSGRKSTSPVKLFTTVGVHPTNALAFFQEPSKDVSDHVAALQETLQAGTKAGAVVAVGELGLDYDRLSYCPMKEQKIGFEAQLVLAERSNLPLFLHSRASGADMYTMLEANRHRFKDGVVHSFDGTASDLEGLLSLNLFIGINGCSLRTEENLDVVKAIPLERLMLETDAPWCEIRPTHASAKHVQTQKPMAKKPDKFVWGTGVKGRCEPWMVAQVCEAVAAVKGVDPAAVARHAHFNTRRVFGL